MKKYAVVCDVSPSEQLTGVDYNVMAFGLLFGIRDPRSFDRVGKDFPDAAGQYSLRKWAGASAAYKDGLVAHARMLLQGGEVMCGGCVADELAIQTIGARAFQAHMGPFPAPSSFNKKGRPRIALGGYKVGGQPVPRYEVLLDDLLVLGWYADVLWSAHQLLVEINDGDITLDALIDKLPNDQGDDEHYKATLLRELVFRCTGRLVHIVGVPEHSDSLERDLLVDNLCGLLRELHAGTWEGSADAVDIYRLRRADLFASAVST